MMMAAEFMSQFVSPSDRTAIPLFVCSVDENVPWILEAMLAVAQYQSLQYWL
jgi:hypothetical protein